MMCVLDVLLYVWLCVRCVLGVGFVGFGLVVLVGYQVLDDQCWIGNVEDQVVYYVFVYMVVIQCLWFGCVVEVVVDCVVIVVVEWQVELCGEQVGDDVVEFDVQWFGID